MDLEQIFQNAGSMDAQNITLLLLSLISQFGSSNNKNSKKLPSVLNAGNRINETANGTEDTDVLLALNLSTMLVKYYSNDPALWNAVMANLEQEEIRKKEEANRRLSPTTSTVLMSIYMLVIAIGTIGNVIVIAAFFRQPALRSRRNAFIINLAVSDLLLCLVTMPLTLIELLNDHWPIGDSVLSCKAAGGLQAVSVFVSTITITAIALDRYQLIVYPTKDVLKRIGSVAGIFFIWTMGFCLASPIFVFRTLEHHDLDYYHKRIENDAGEVRRRSDQSVHSIDYCYEKWPVTHGRAIYSAFTLLVQYAVPILIISVLHSQICQRLHLRHSTIWSMNSQNAQRQIEERKRLRRRHRLLMAISLIFSITWLPLNVLNLTLDLYNPFKLPRDKEMMLIIYAACHLFGMSSACANPFLYGWFNENFRREFKLIFSAPSRLLCPASESDDGHQRQSRHLQSTTSAFLSVANTISTLRQSITLRRTSLTQSAINTSSMKKKSTVSTLGVGKPLTTVKEMSETIGEHQNAVGTNKTISLEEMNIKTESFEKYKARSSAEMDDEIMLHPISMPILKSSSTSETHL